MIADTPVNRFKGPILPSILGWFVTVLTTHYSGRERHSATPRETAQSSAPFEARVPAPRLTTVVVLGPSMLSPFLLGGVAATPLGKLLLALVAITVIVLVGRFVLSVAWKLLVLATIVVAGLWVATTVLG